MKRLRLETLCDRTTAVIPDEALAAVVRAILDSGRAGAKKWGASAPLMYRWHEKHYLGAAHGLVGILFVLLQHRWIFLDIFLPLEHVIVRKSCSYSRSFMSDESLQTVVKPTLEYVKQLQVGSRVP